MIQRSEAATAFECKRITGIKTNRSRLINDFICANKKILCYLFRLKCQVNLFSSCLYIIEMISRLFTFESATKKIEHFAILPII